MQIPLTLPGPPEGVRAVLSLISRLASAMDRVRVPVVPFAAFLGNVWGAYVLVLLIALAIIVLYFALGRMPMMRDTAVFFCAAAESVLVTGLMTGEWVRASVDARFMVPALGLMLVMVMWAAVRLVSGEKTDKNGKKL